jgi:phosphoserine phosphatase SerB
MQPQSVLITVTGSDRPGVTSALFAGLAAHDVEVIDVEQVVIRSNLMLSVLLTLRGEAAPLRRAVARVSDGLGIDMEVAIGEEVDDAGPRRAGHHQVMVLGNPLRAGAVGEVARRIADLGANIDSITRLSNYPVTSLELTVSGADSAELRTTLATAAKETNTDIAVERAGLHRRAKRLLVMDVDSTLVQGEIIEMLAEHAGCADQVARVTEATMAGELDFTESLRARVALLRGLPESVLDEVRAKVQLMPGARTLIRTVRRMGFRCGVVSGGFTQFTDDLVRTLGLDFAAANTLEIVDGRLTGRLSGEIVDRAGKARALVHFAQRFEVPLSQTVAVGDGANDIDMLNTAGLGIAFNAKPAVCDAADASLSQPYLDAILFLLGISRDEVEQADADDPMTGSSL